jgi:hypothetical protein
MTPDKTNVAKQMLASGAHAITQIAAVLGVSRERVSRARRANDWRATPRLDRSSRGPFASRPY